MANPADDKPTDRRGFFRHSLAAALGPLANLFEKRLDRVRASFDAVMPTQLLMRPPGAIRESDFLRICQSCGKCAEVCPAQAIFMRSETRRAAASRSNAEFPVISASRQPCRLCTDLACMASCPSGALVRTEIDRIRSGTAAWAAGQCLRTKGYDCRRCVDECPRGTAALAIGPEEEPGRLPPVIVESNGCVGCGICEHVCLADPKAILVYPNR
jgi:MauM/NapG family ferredoxin protein